ncbi:MAG: hypothetical protein AB8G05_15785 [Oligoflexales bacterium]
MRTVFCLLIGLICTVTNGHASEVNNGFADGQKAEISHEVSLENGFG